MKNKIKMKKIMITLLFAFAAFTTQAQDEMAYRFEQSY